ncbi:MAG: RNB domain-containing ribonuclease, partial [Nocardioides sp.]|nr:RNB domain-containing ribonuclease [Nocardioides sp.]
MPSSPVVHFKAVDDEAVAAVLREGIERIQAELEVSPEFPPEVEAAAAAAAAAPRMPALDRTDLAFVTIDPETA